VMERVSRIVGHLEPVTHDKTITSCSTQGAEPVNPQRWNGWGYSDTSFAMNDDGEVQLQGSRYLFSGQTMPNLRTWMEGAVGLDINSQTPPQEFPSLPPAKGNDEFMTAVAGHCKRVSTSDNERLFHSHGHTAQEIYTLFRSNFTRVVDVVIWPGSHADVEAIVAAAVKLNVCLIPFGGGTSVTQALLCPKKEQRMIVSVDMHMMNAIKWINRENMTVCIEAGAVGKDIEEKLRRQGYVLGHEPDSAEFSTMGGWVATRASGMRKNKYGNIEDILVHVKMVTPLGTVQKNVQVPRISTGPDIHQMILGSEGTYGIITEVVTKLCYAPPTTRYGSIVFPNFESGVACLREVARQKCAPVSIRLVDNTQFQFGQALKPAENDWKVQAVDKVKKWYVTKLKGFDPEVMVAATLLFEGTKAEVQAQEKRVYAIAAQHGGLKGGEQNGIRGYFLTYMIAYLRDFGMGYNFIAESFETSVPYENVLSLCTTVKARMKEDAKNKGVSKELFVSCRVTQLYDAGACVYFYFGFMWDGLENPIQTFSEIEANARNEVLAMGGSLSHHHGVGKLRKGWMSETISPVGQLMLEGLKEKIDPTNIFANGNLIGPGDPL